VQELLAKPWFQALLAVVLFFCGAVLSAFFYRRSTRRSQISYHLVRRYLLGYQHQRLPSDMEFRFRGELVYRLDQIKLMLWNDGNITVSDADQVASDPLILGGDLRVLDATVTKATRAVNKVRVVISEDRKSVKLDFDYLDPGDGAVIEILCDQLKAFALLGTFRGMRSGLRKLPSLPFSWIIVTILVGFAFMAAGVLVLVGYRINEAAEQASLPTLITRITVAVIFLTAFVWLVWLLWKKRRRYPRELTTVDFVDA
jgi:hypothetical protein